MEIFLFTSSLIYWSMAVWTVRHVALATNTKDHDALLPIIVAVILGILWPITWLVFHHHKGTFNEIRSIASDFYHPERMQLVTCHACDDDGCYSDFHHYRARPGLYYPYCDDCFTNLKRGESHPRGS